MAVGIENRHEFTLQEPDSAVVTFV